MKTGLLASAVVSAALLCGCASLFGVVRSVADAQAWAEGQARGLASSVQPRTPLPPRSRSVLVGSWKTTMRSRTVSSRNPGDEDWHNAELTYHFRDDGTYSCETVSSFKSSMGRRSSATLQDVRSSINGTWSYENGILTLCTDGTVSMGQTVLRIAATEDRYNLLWYGNDEFDPQEEDGSVQAARDRIERSLRGTGGTVLSFGRSSSNGGVTASWSETYHKLIGRTIVGAVTTCSTMKRCAGAPRTAALSPERPAPAASMPAETPASLKWRRVEKTDLGENRARIVYDLSDGVSIEEADRALLPLVCGELKESFLRNNPDVDPGSVRATADYETRDGRRTLVYTASAFTMQPVLLKLAYDDQSRRGSISYRISAHGNGDAAFGYAQRTIAELALRENVVLEAGKEAPPGAKYKLLDQRLEDDVLTIEFMLVE